MKPKPPPPGAWPDLDAPGVPLHPDTRDFHWIDVGPDEPILLVGDWCPAERNWFFDGGVSAPDDLAACRYLGPVITPTEHDAALREAERAAARQARRKADTAYQDGWNAAMEVALAGGAAGRSPDEIPS